MSLPFEELRSLARHSGDSADLVIETSRCLGEFATDPTQLVTVCRRLLAHHPACGPLWWLCARVLVADDPSTAAREARQQIENDGTGSQLASQLPFPHDEPIAIVGWPELTREVFRDRPDLDLAIVRVPGRTRPPRLPARGGAPRVVDATELLALEPTHLLIETVAADPERALVGTGVGEIIALLPETPVWLVAGVGRLLPARLFEVLTAEVERQAVPFETMATARALKVAGPDGLFRPDTLASRIDCPAAPELLRL